MNQDSAKKILYVDDETTALKYFSALFGDRFDILTAESADEGFAIIESDPDQIAVLVTDQRMPGRTGVELMEQVRSRYPNIVRVLTTAFTELDYAIKAVNEGGAFRYLTKPYEEEEMIGTLLRATEYHAAMTDRDHLLAEKLSVLHRLVVMDRVRGLATMTAALNGQFRNAWKALVAYIRRSPTTMQIQQQLDEMAFLDLTLLARREGESMVRTVQAVMTQTTEAASWSGSEFDLIESVRSHVDSVREGYSEDDVDLALNASNENLTITSDEGLTIQLIQMMIRRMADIQEHPTTLHLSIESTDSTVSLSVRGDFDEFSEGQLASFFSAAIPLSKWPLGLEMDVLGCYLICHHLGGTFEILSGDNHQPTLMAEFPKSAVTVGPYSPARQSSELEDQWFDQVYACLQAWQNEVVD